jgi:acyl-CoA thioester hydrolase
MRRIRIAGGGVAAPAPARQVARSASRRDIRAMPRIYTRSVEITPEAIDANGHVNNLENLRWMQETATAHSAAQGWPVERYLESGMSWFVRSHFIEYVSPAFQGDTLAVHTWVKGMGSRSSPRRYLFWREGDRKTVARAETLWVFVDMHTGRPRRIPRALHDAFPVIPTDEEALAELGLAAPV